MKPYKFWTFQNKENAEQKYTLFGVEMPDWRKHMGDPNQKFTLVDSGLAIFKGQGEAESLARELTDLTGVQWTHDLTHDHPQDLECVDYKFFRPDGVTIYLNDRHCGCKQGQWELSYMRPRGPEGYIEIYRNNSRVPNPSMKINSARGMKVVAREIVRRLLPDIDLLHPEVVKRIENLTRAKTIQAETTTVIAEALGASHPNPGKNNFYFTYGGSQDARVNYGGSVDLTFRSLPFDKALALAKWLKANA